VTGLMWMGSPSHERNATPILRGRETALSQHIQILKEVVPQRGEIPKYLEPRRG